MERETLYEDFFKKLRVAFNTTSIYFKEHPAFIKSVESLEESIYVLLAISDPLTVGVTPVSLFCAEKYWEGEQLYKDLAHAFHRRKIKTIEIRQGITVEELIVFLNSIALMPSEILKRGGLSFILGKENITHIRLTELDYSELLQAGGIEECTDVWGYLLREALGKKNAPAITDIADHFEKFITTSGTKIFDDATVRENVEQLFAYLKENDRERLYRCTKKLLRTVLQDRASLDAGKTEQLKSFLQYATEKEFVDTLWGEMAANERFDPLNLVLFSKLLGQKYRQAFTVAFTDKVKAELRANPAMIKRVVEVFSQVDDPFFSELYHRYLSTLMEESFKDGAISFNRQLVTKNYRLLQLNVLTQEKRGEQLQRVANSIIKEFDAIVKDKDFAYLTTLATALEDIKKKNVAQFQGFEELGTRISAFAEETMLSDDIGFDPGFFVGYMQKSTIGVDTYIDKIFSGSAHTSYIIELFLKFFPDEIDALFQRIKRKVDDIAFMKKLIESVCKVDNIYSFKFLKDIFYVCDSFLKLEILRALEQASYLEADFLYALLEESGVIIKKQAVIALMKDQGQRQKAAELLLSFSDQLWFRNKFLEENVKIVRDVGLREAKEYLRRLAQRRFFWNRRLRFLAKRTIEELDARKD